MAIENRRKLENLRKVTRKSAAVRNVSEKVLGRVLEVPRESRGKALLMGQAG